jgi:hypothetical protein
VAETDQQQVRNRMTRGRKEEADMWQKQTKQVRNRMTSGRKEWAEMWKKQTNSRWEVG